jgi:hypothetical protein
MLRRQITLGAAGNAAGRAEQALGRQLRPAIVASMRTAARLAKPVLIARTLDAPPASDSPRSKPGAYASGELARSWEIDPEISHTRGAGWVLTATVYNTQLYAAFQNDGVKANMPKMGLLAMQMIERWIVQRGIVSLFNEPLPRLAKRIVGAMNGRDTWRIKPRKMIERAQSRVREIFTTQIRNGIARATAAAGR